MTVEFLPTAFAIPSLEHRVWITGAGGLIGSALLDRRLQPFRRGRSPERRGVRSISPTPQPSRKCFTPFGRRSSFIVPP